jgi:hypothetical protein
MGLAAVRGMREARVPAGPDEVAAFETDVLAGFVLARAAAGLSDKTISAEVSNLEQVRAWFGRPLWGMRPADADEYFGKVMRAAAQNTRLKRAQALKVWFAFLELRHKPEIYSSRAMWPSARSTRRTGPGAAGGLRFGSRRRRRRPAGCSRGGGRSWRRAGSSRRPRGTTRRPG